MTTAKLIGDRLRMYRIQRKWSQEVLAERAGLHPTYIGQLERGEKNATIESISKVAAALDISLSELFEGMAAAPEQASIPAQCYFLIQNQHPKDQVELLNILTSIVKYKNECP